MENWYFFFKKKYSNLIFVKDGGWHFTCLKSPEELEKKLSNFAHHFEFKESGLNIDDVKKYIAERRVIYDYKADQKQYKWSGKSILKKIDSKLLPNYIFTNLSKFSEWLDIGHIATYPSTKLSSINSRFFNNLIYDKDRNSIKKISFKKSKIEQEIN